MAAPWPLLGRGDERDTVAAAVGGPEARGIVVVGAAGVGKTRLAHEALAVLGDEVAVEWSAATASSASIPFGALAALLPEGEVAAPDDRLRLFRRTAAVLKERAAGQTLVLVVDDAHWLDAGGAALVHHVALTGTARLLLTVRAGDPAPDAVVALWKDGLVERIELAPLTAAAVEALVAAVLDGPVERATQRRLRELSRGNVLFLRELVLAGLDSGDLAFDGDVWRWSGFHPSTRLVTLVEDRLARVGERGRAVLRHVAVAEHLPLATLEALCDEEGVAEVEVAGLVAVDEGAAEVRPAHPLYAEVVNQGMTTVERRRITARLADALAPSACSRAERLRVAAWRLASGTPAPPSLLTEAAEVANAVFDHLLAERLARRAVDDGGGLRASLALAQAHIHQGRWAEADRVLSRLPAQATCDRERVDVAVARYNALVGDQGFRAEFESVLLEAEEAVSDPRLLSYLAAQRATLLSFAGRLDEAISLASAATAESDEATHLRAVPALGGAWLCAGQCDAAAAFAARMLEPALRHQDEMPQAPFWVISTQLPALLGAGRLDEADGVVRMVEEVAATTAASTATDTFLALARGVAALRRGAARTATRELRSSLPGMREIARWRTPFPLVHLAEASALTGDAAGATAASAEADDVLPQARIFEGLVQRARGWAAFARGERSTATDLLLEAAAWSAAHGHRSAELLSLHDVVRLESRQDVAARAVAVARSCEGPWAAGVSAHAAAMVADDGEALDAAAAAFQEMGALLVAAEAAAQAAAAFRRRSLVARAERSAARARVLLSRCEDARTPILEDLDGALPLTAREREVARLAAEGLSASAVADRLFVSTRTVEGHLYRIYTKLGVHDRAGLALVLGVVGAVAEGMGG